MPETARGDEALLLGFAMALAYWAHRGQVDKVGQPYIGHLTRVAGHVADDGEDYDEHATAVAYLHDIIEDTPITITTLFDLGLPGDVVKAVHLLTRTARLSDRTYYATIRENPLALRVKLADIADNMDPERLALLDDNTRQRLLVKYATALAALVDGETT